MITQLVQEGFPAALVCQTLGVSRAGYYAQVQGGVGLREQQDARLRPLVQQIFWEHKRRYGARRIAAELAARGEACGPGRPAGAAGRRYDPGDACPGRPCPGRGSEACPARP